MLELIRRKSAAGEAPSPSDIESAATATAAASTPRGALAVAAGGFKCSEISCCVLDCLGRQLQTGGPRAAGWLRQPKHC